MFFDETFNKQKAKLVFERSKMKVIDDWKDAARGRVLCFEDFLEGCAEFQTLYLFQRTKKLKLWAQSLRA